MVNLVLFNCAEHPYQHIEEVNTDVRCNTSRLRFITLPTDLVPVATRCYISKVDVVDLILRTLHHLFAQRNDSRVVPELQDGVYLLACFFFDLCQCIHVPWIQHKGLLADCVGMRSEEHTSELQSR